VNSTLKVGTADYGKAGLRVVVSSDASGVKTVGAQVVVTDSTGSTTTQKVIKLGTIDGLTGGVIQGPFTSAVKVNSTTGTLVSDDSVMRATMVDQFGTAITSKLFPELNAGSFSQTTIANQDSGTGVSKYWSFRSNGNAYAVNGTWTNGSSDMRVKKDFEEIKDPFSTMRKIKAGTWRMNTKNGDNRFGIGVLANGLYDDYPEASLDNGDQELIDGTIVKDVLTVQAGDSGVLAAVHHASIMQLMDIVKEAITAIAGVTTDESAKAALEALAERIPNNNPS
uniref:tail fiber domain-containing protein n=1 Tax=Kluyvera ascorbata TaxID=51288 RepID=UPI002896EF59